MFISDLTARREWLITNQKVVDKVRVESVLKTEPSDWLQVYDYWHIDEKLF